MHLQFKFSFLFTFIEKITVEGKADNKPPVGQGSVCQNGDVGKPSYSCKE